MRRLVSKPFWRLEIENWGPQQDEFGNFGGYETFYSGSSAPYKTKKDALAAAIVALKCGSWVQIEKYENE